MSYQALARKWRPKTFDQVIGQDHVVSALSNALNNQRVHHAFLFTGTRGVGKTTLARIFAKALNCEVGVDATPCEACVACRGVDQGNFIDLIEVDAASRTKVDDTRELLDNVQYTPTQGRYKIYLIDEVHMLSTHSFNALLKTLEEPPDHVKFLLATTDPQKLPTTILSRCIQFNLKSMDMGRLTGQLAKILDAEGIAYDSSGLLVLARSANGSVRDALSLLDQAIAFGDGKVDSDQVREMLGMIDERYTFDLLDALCRGDTTRLMQVVAEMAERSVDYNTGIDELLTLIHNVSLYLVSPESVKWKRVDTSALADLAQVADPEVLQLFYQIALVGKRDLPLAPDPRTGFEMALLRMIAFKPAKPGVNTGPSHQAPSNNPKRIVRESRESPSQSNQSQSSQSPSTQNANAQTPAAPAAMAANAPSDLDGGVNPAQRQRIAPREQNRPANDANDLDAQAERERRIDQYLSTQNEEQPARNDLSHRVDDPISDTKTDDASPRRSDTHSAPSQISPAGSGHSTIASEPPEQIETNLSSDPSADPLSNHGQMRPEAFTEIVRGKTLSVESLADIRGWNEFVEQSGLNGMAKEMVMNMAPKQVEGKTVVLSLETTNKHLFNANRMKKVEAHCKNALNLDVAFRVDIEDSNHLSQETPSKNREKRKQEREDDARHAFVQDPNVQEMVDMFDAKVVEDSIKPSEF